MRLAYVLNTYPSPSHSFIRREIAALERSGHEVTRLAMRPHDGPLPDPADQAEAARTEYVLAVGLAGLLRAALGELLRGPGRVLAALGQALRLGRRSEAGLLRHLVYWLEAAQVTRRARALGVARLHAQFGTNSASVAMLARTMGAPPFSFTIHGPEEFDKPALIGLPEKLAQADFAVAVSSYGRSQLARQVGPSVWKRLHVVHCGIEAEKFDAPVPMPQTRPWRMVCVGRFAEQKGHLVLIEAMAELRRRGVLVHLVLVGDGSMRPEIEAAIAAADLGDCVRLAGWLDEAGVMAEIDAAQAMVLPSFAEGLPVVLMEAMAAARPVISTWVAGIPELVQPGRNGWLVPAGDAMALTDAIIDFSGTPHERLVQMGKSARAAALTRHGIDTEAAKLAALFAQRPRTQPD